MSTESWSRRLKRKAIGNFSLEFDLTRAILGD
jgi:hypothetical protein